MCGICGALNLRGGRPVEPDVLNRMMASLRHRGPDDEGRLLDGPVGLGHQRLSIIDLSEQGRQPMANEDDSLWILFNGEIYNYLELRRDLLAQGHRFRSHTDTEVLLHLFEEEGPDCLQRLNGMFAFVIWNARDRTLFAARDRFGIKPLYYATAGDWFVFASEIKALFHSGLVRPELHPPGLADFLTFQFCLGSKTLFRGVERLAPGHYLLARVGGDVQVTKYWDLDFTIDTHHTEEYFEHQLVRLLEDAVSLQLRADVPVGAHLSGGLDSSAVACLAAGLLGGQLATFHGSFREGPEFDETAHARSVSQHAKTCHFEVFPTAQDFVEMMPRLIYFMDEPAAGPGIFPQYCVSRLARDHVKVVLGGQGGDEIFGGYARYLVAYLEQCIKGGIEGTHEDQKYVVTFESILPNLPQLQGYLPLLRQFWAHGLFEPEANRYFRLIDRSQGLAQLLDTDLLPPEREYSPYEAFRQRFESTGCRSLFNKMTRFDMETLLPALLQVEDRTSMAVSLESRVPLLDHRIAELVASMPPRIKYEGGRSKHIFRRAIRHLVPTAVGNRSDKMGFPVPLNVWYRTAPVRDFVRDVLLSDRARQRGFVKPAVLEQFLDAEEPYGRRLWGLLSLELWSQTFLDGTTFPG